jgi:hypothetical protein
MEPVCPLSYLHKTLVFVKTMQAFPILIDSKEEFRRRIATNTDTDRSKSSCDNLGRERLSTGRVVCCSNYLPPVIKRILPPNLR